MAKDKSEQAQAKNKAEERQIVRANINREMTKSEQFMSVYANDTQLQLTAWDVRLIFGVIDEVATPEKNVTTVRQLGEVRMSLPHAKRVAQILTAHILHYEEVTKSEIHVPE
jgi:hypothetical protein